MTNPDRRS